MGKKQGILTSVVREASTRKEAIKKVRKDYGSLQAYKILKIRSAKKILPTVFEVIFEIEHRKKWKPSSIGHLKR